MENVGLKKNTKQTKTHQKPFFYHSKYYRKMPQLDPSSPVPCHYDESLGCTVLWGSRSKGIVLAALLYLHLNQLCDQIVLPPPVFCRPLLKLLEKI